MKTIPLVLVLPFGHFYLKAVKQWANYLSYYCGDTMLLFILENTSPPPQGLPPYPVLSPQGVCAPTYFLGGMLPTTAGANLLVLWFWVSVQQDNDLLQSSGRGRGIHFLALFTLINALASSAQGLGTLFLGKG